MQIRTLIPLAIALWAVPALGQTPVGLSPGDPIRATYRVETSVGPRTSEIRGAFGDLSPERLRLTLHSSGKTFDQEVPLEQLVRLEVPGGRSAARGAGKGALFGGIAGAVLGFVAVAACASDNDSFFQCGGTDFLVGPLVLGGMGAGAGAAIGAVVGAREWREVVVPPARK